MTEQLIEGVPVRLLTLWRPWPRMFDADVGKRVENRPRPLRKLPLWLALHAAHGPRWAGRARFVPEFRHLDGFL